MKNLFLTLFALFMAQLSFACTAGFSNSNTSANNNLLQVTFTNSSNPGTLTAGQTASYLVRFGDGQSGYVAYNGNLVHNYTASGTYTAKIIVTVVDSSNQNLVCADSQSASVTVNYSPCASTVSVSYGSNGAVTFTTSTPGGASGMTYFWVFGDGNYGSGSPANHTYASNGIYYVTLFDTSTSPACTYENQLTVTITNAASSYNCSTAHAAFITSTSNNIGYVTNQSTPPSGTATISAMYYWNFGDGSGIVNGLPGYHNYAAAGTYNICLVVKWVDSFNTSNVFCSDSICHSVTVGNPPAQITGTLSLDTALCNVASPAFKVWLITLNTSTNILAAIDSVTLTSPNHTYTFSNEPANTYRVKAMVTNGPTSGNGPLPTYGLDSLHYSGATTFTYSGAGVSSGHDINLQCGTVTSGPGFIGGNVTQGANKNANKTSGVPAPNVEILISNAAGNIAYALTDVSGNFSFSNLPVPGTYTLYPEVLGYANTPWIVNLSSTTPSISNANFTIHTVSHVSNPVLAIQNLSASAQHVEVYPNPSTGVVNINLSQDANAIVTDVLGNRIFAGSLLAGVNEINLSNLSSGVYFISIQSEGINYSNKLVIQH